MDAADEIEMTEMIAIAYTDDTLAAQAAEELVRRVDDLVIDPDAVSYVVCERAGDVQLMTSYRSGTTEIWSKFWSSLLEILMIRDKTSNIDSDFRQRTRGLMQPGSSLLFAVVEGVDPIRAQLAVSQYGGTPLSTVIDKSAAPELWGNRGAENANI